jgi:hypothetical protein
MACTRQGNEEGRTARNGGSTTSVTTKMRVLTPKFGKESDLWVQLGKESVWWKERIFSDVFGKGVCGRLSAPDSVKEQ